MTNMQQALVSTWVIGPTTFLLAVITDDGVSYNWAIVLSIGFGICKYLRSDVPKNDPDATIFDDMSEFRKIITLIYYMVVAAVTFYLVTKYPESVDYNNKQFLIFMFVFLLPILPSWISNEIELYKYAAHT